MNKMLSCQISFLYIPCTFLLPIVIAVRIYIDDCDSIIMYLSQLHLVYVHACMCWFEMVTVISF